MSPILPYCETCNHGMIPMFIMYLQAASIG
jgi:hypothetical protein